jgi:transposase-like protein
MRLWQRAIAFDVSETTIYAWRKQDRIDRGELDGLSTDQAIELAAARGADPSARDRAPSVAQG